MMPSLQSTFTCLAHGLLHRQTKTPLLRQSGSKTVAKRAWLKAGEGG